MRKFLSRIFSVTLIAAVAILPLMAQTAKKDKAGSSSSKRVEALALKPSSKSEKKAKSKKSLRLPQRKSAESLALRKAKKGIASRRNHRPVIKSDAQLPDIIGSVIYSENEDRLPGVYQIPLSSEAAFDLKFEDLGASGGAVIQDGIYYQTSYMSFWGMIIVECAGYDLSSGQQVYYAEADDSCIASSGLAVDPLSGRNYGFFFDIENELYNFGYIDFAETPSVTPVASVSDYYSAIAIAADGTIYAVRNNYDSDGETVASCTLCKINRTSGEATEVGELGLVSQYITSAVMDLASGRMFWTYSNDTDGGIAEINLSTGEASVICEFEDMDEVCGLAIDAPAASDAAPGECSDVNVIFLNGGLSGECSLKAPSLLFDGAQGSGALSVKVAVDGNVIASKDDVEWGAEVVLPLDMSEPGAGLYTFSVYAENEAGAGPKSHLRDIFVGVDTPAATSATLKYVNGNMELSWLPVSSAVNGGYIDLDNLSYTVKRADGSVAAEGLTITSFSEPMAETESLTPVYYTVYAVAGNFTSAPAKSNVVMLGHINPPYTSDFYNNELEGFTVIDVDGDEATWKVYTNYVRCLYSDSNDKNDWLISPPLLLEGGKSYLLSFDAWCEASMFPESLEVMWGDNNTAEAMTNKLLDNTDLSSYTSANHLQVAKYITPAEDGIYYIGWHATSEADMYYLNLSNFTIEDGVSAEAPGAVSNLVAKADADGALSVNVSFNAPDKTLSDNPLTSLDRVELYRGDSLVKTFSAPAPGEALSYLDALDAEGEVTYKVVAYNVAGAGVSESVSVFVGVYLPMAPTEATISRTSTDGEVIVNWTPVTHDVNGVAIAPDKVVYDLYKFEGYSRVAIATGLTATSYTAQLVAQGNQDFVQCIVFARTAAGEGEGQVTDMIAVGTPYPGLQYSFPEGEISDEYVWGIADIVGEPAWSTYTDESGIRAADGDNGFVGMKGDYLDDAGMLFTGLISLDKMMNPSLTFYVYNLIGDAGASTNTVKVLISADGGEFSEVYSKNVNEICGENEGWYRVLVPLNDYAGKNIQVGLEAVVNMYAYTFFDNIKVGSMPDYDLEAKAIAAPANAYAGQNFNIYVDVANEGLLAAEDFEVQLFCEDILCQTLTGDNLASGQSKEFIFNYDMPIDRTAPVAFYAKVVYAADQLFTNNQTSVVRVNLVESKIPAPQNLRGESTPEGVRLSWEHPDFNISPEPVTFDFEDGDAFSDTYGDWTFVDEDKSEVGGFQGIDLPGIETGVSKGSFWIWDNDAVSVNASFEAHSGTHYLFALFRYDDGTVSDWAISPRLSGDAQTISFYARSYSEEYPEAIEVYTSSSDSELSSFSIVEGVANANPVPQEWTLYTVEVPAGTNYFAIRSCATGSFMLMVDDVTFIPAYSISIDSLKGYDVYRDGVKLTAEPIADTEWLDSDIENDTEARYEVVAVYEHGGVSAPVSVTVIYKNNSISLPDGQVKISAKDGKIVIENVDGVEVSVATASGTLIYRASGADRHEIPASSGLYIVSVGTKARTILLR